MCFHLRRKAGAWRRGPLGKRECARACVRVWVRGSGPACSAGGKGAKAGFPTFFQQSLASQGCSRNGSPRMELRPVHYCTSSPLSSVSALRSRASPSQARGAAHQGEEGRERSEKSRGGGQTPGLQDAEKWGETLGKHVGGGAPWRGRTLCCPLKETGREEAAMKRPHSH